MSSTASFNTFLSNVRLTQNQINNCITGHSTLRSRLENDADLSPYILKIFLQGSYRRATAVRPKGDSRADVDVIVVTNLHEDDYTPQDAIDLFMPFMKKHYTASDDTPKYRVQGRSIGIELSYVDLDLVITSAPSESQLKVLQSDELSADETLEEAGDTLIKSLVELEESSASTLMKSFDSSQPLSLLERSVRAAQWMDEPLRIPDRDAAAWKDTHPVSQIQWTWQKNKKCNGHYLGVVKALKWWRRLNDTPRHPKGYPLEHLVGYHCPDSISSVAQGIVQTLESIAASYSYEIALETVPTLPDHGVPEHNVMGRVSASDFKTFHEMIATAAKVARRAFNEQDAAKSSLAWRELLGDKFPETVAVKSSAQILTPGAPSGSSAPAKPRPLKDNPYA